MSKSALAVARELLESEHATRYFKDYVDIYRFLTKVYDDHKFCVQVANIVSKRIFKKS